MVRMYRASFLLLLLLCVFTMLLGCGQKGDLYLPDEREQLEEQR